MKFFNRPKWNRILLAVVCLLAITGIASGSYAAYTSQAHQRGVARNRDTDTVRFASNYLQNCVSTSDTSNYEGRTVLYTEEDKTKERVSFELDIYNYANGNRKLVSQSDIKYDLKIIFKNGDVTGYNVIDNITNKTFTKSTTGTEYEFTLSSQMLAGRNASRHQYTLSFPGADIDKLKIVVTATPTNFSATNNQKLAAVIAPCTTSIIQDFHAEGRYIDEATDTNPGQYKGFNYEIFITSGVATGTLTWNKEYVEIDRFFLVKLGKTEEEINEILTAGQLKIHMDQSAGTGDYLIPFYINITDKEKTIPASWDGMRAEKVITFSAKEITAESDTSAETQE